MEIGTEDGEQSQLAWKEGWETESQGFPELQECLQSVCNFTVAGGGGKEATVASTSSVQSWMCNMYIFLGP